jgi:hypothetical protein
MPICSVCNKTVSRVGYSAMCDKCADEYFRRVSGKPTPSALEKLTKVQKANGRKKTTIKVGW